MGCLFSSKSSKPEVAEEQKDDSHSFPNPIKILAKGVKCVGEEALGVVGKALGTGLGVAEKAVLGLTTKLDFPHLSETCIPGVYSYNGLHNDFENLFSTELFDELGIVKNILALRKVIMPLEGQKMTPENFKIISDACAKEIGFSETDFGFCPDKFDVVQLKALVSTCPFITMGLHVQDGYVVLDATGDSKNPLTAMICKCLPEDYATGKLFISEDFSQLYITQNGVKYLPDSEEFDVKLRTFITSVAFFFEIIHACLHVYAYIMLGAATHATTSTDMDNFMNQYQQKILTKYIEVAKLLITDSPSGLVVGGFWPCDHKKALAATTEIFKYLAKAKNADDWFKNIMLCGSPALLNNKNLLPQCRPYVALTQKVAKASCEKVSGKEMSKVNEKLNEYLSKTGGNDTSGLFNLNTFQQWIECQTMMGILHGSTTTLSRIIFTKYLCYDGNWENDTFQNLTLGTIATVAGTLMGLEADHEINQCNTLSGTDFHGMMKDFQSQTADLQKDFWGALEQDDIKLLGWLYSVWGSNMVGQTQLTITTYI